MAESESRPLARTERLVVQELGDETLVYDSETDVAHCLTEVAARVWKGCDGQHDLGALATLAACGKDSVVQAVGELRAKGLLIGDAAAVEGSASGGLSRRHALGRMATIGAGAVAIPLIFSATATAANSVGLHGACNGTTHTCMPGLTCSGGSCLVPVLGSCTTTADCVPGALGGCVLGVCVVV
jgi:hypothetical protein